MPIAMMPPSALTIVAVASSSIAMQSHRMLPLGVRISSARWPIAKAGWVPMPITLGSYWRYELKLRAASDLSVVHVWPPGGTYCRSSSQIAHCAGGFSLGAYWVPQAVQMKASMRCAPWVAWIAQRRRSGSNRPERCRAASAPRIARASEPGSHTSRDTFDSGRRELGEIVNADHLLEAGDAVGHLLESVLAEQAMLLILEVLGHGLVLVARDDFLQLWKQVGILARRVRSVHRDERPHGGDQFTSLVVVAKAVGRQLENHRRHPPPGLVLQQQHADEIEHLIGLLDTREDVLLLRLLVIVLDEVADDLCGLGDDRGIEILLGVELAHRRLVDQQHAVEHAMLAHQVLGQGDQLLGLVGCGAVRLRFLLLVLGRQCRDPQAAEHDQPGGAGGPREATARLLDIEMRFSVHAKILHGSEFSAAVTFATPVHSSARSPGTL